jgi:hypothetical protein
VARGRRTPGRPGADGTMTTVTEPVKPRIGYRMRELADIVSAMPGCSKSDALRAAGLPTCGIGSGRELNRAVSAGLILVEHEHAKRCRLFASERPQALAQGARGTPPWHQCRARGRDPGRDHRAGCRTCGDLEHDGVATYNLSPVPCSGSGFCLPLMNELTFA